MESNMKCAMLAMLIIGLSGCTSSIGFGGDDGAGIKSSVAKDGKILMVEATDGDGKTK
jgi:hypothetical protein